MKQTKSFYSKLTKFYLGLVVMLLVLACGKDDRLVPDTNIEVEERQAGLGDGWEPAPCVNITLFIDPTACGPNWEASLPAAIAEYNSAPDVAINMQQVFSPPADIEITCADFANNNSFGLGEWPDADGVIGGNIFMNTDFENACADPCFHVGSMMHEISHNLGFCHGEQEGIAGAVGPWILNPDGTFTQVNTGQTTALEHITGTPTGLGDPNSIFNVHDCANPNCTLSPDDIIALQAFYPLCECPELADCECRAENLSIAGPDVLCLNESGQYCITGLNLNPAMVIIWSIDNVVPAPGTFPTKKEIECTDFSSMTPGEHILTAWILDGECNYSVSKTITVHEDENCVECYCECEIENDEGEIDYIQHEIDCDEDCNGPITTPIGWEIVSCEKMQRFIK